MSRETAQFDRRTLLRGALATAALVPLAGALASCGGSSPSGGGGGGGGGPKSATNPFGLAKTSSVEAVIFNGGYGYDYVKYAATRSRSRRTAIHRPVCSSTGTVGLVPGRRAGHARR